MNCLKFISKTWLIVFNILFGVSTTSSVFWICIWCIKSYVKLCEFSVGRNRFNYSWSCFYNKISFFDSFLGYIFSRIFILILVRSVQFYFSILRALVEHPNLCGNSWCIYPFTHVLWLLWSIFWKQMYAVDCK